LNLLALSFIIGTSNKGINDAIKFVKHIKKEVDNYSNLKNIILDRIKQSSANQHFSLLTL
tara:strand:+ start:329 stop:508 length:180 start_codon:yes stop_codon:yes gene_type:complete